MGEWIKVADAADIPVGRSLVVDADGEDVAICHLEDGFYAIEDRCTHDNGPLGEGPISGNIITCPRHGATFDVKTGKALTAPAYGAVRTWPVRVENGEVKIQVE